MKKIVHFIFLLLLGISLVPILAACANTRACKRMQSDIDTLENQLLLCRKKQNQASALSEQWQRSLSLMQDKITHLDERVRSLESQEEALETEDKVGPDKIDSGDRQDQQTFSFQQSEISEITSKEFLKSQAPTVLHGQDSHWDADLLYHQSLAELKKGDIESARNGFQEYLKSSPHTSFSDNALYWLAECFYQQRKFKMAAENFQKVIDNYPTGNKVPAATLKLGYSCFNIHDYDISLSIFKNLVAQYPKSEEVPLAKKMVDKINSLLHGPTK
jgi:tol-pal system protein YbgF